MAASKESTAYTNSAYGIPNGDPDSLATSIEYYWKLDGDGTDTLGNKDLTAVNSPDFGTGHVFSQAYTNDGSVKYFSATLASAPTSTDYSIAMWVNPADTVSRYMALFGTSSVAAWFIGFQRNTPQWEVNGYFNAVLKQGIFSGVDTDTWKLIIAWWNATAETWSVSVNDGTAVTATSAAADANTGTGINIGANAGSLPWNGLIGPVAVWSRLLTSDERTSYYNGGAGRVIRI